MWWGSAALVMGGICAAANAATTPFTGALDFGTVTMVGVGGSLLASGLAARLIAEHVFGLDLGDAVEALRGTSDVYRSKQSLTLTLSARNGMIYLSAEQRFDLHALGHPSRQHTLRLYSNVVRWRVDGEFDYVTEPDRTTLRGPALLPFLGELAGKPQFEKTYAVTAAAPHTFVVGTNAYYRFSDRLAWTVDNISKDFQVRINDYTGLAGSVDVRINHHRERQITENIVRRSSQEGNVIEFSFLGDVLPFQGFEVQWHYAGPARAGEATT